MLKVAHLPGVFDQIKTDDAKFEISASNTIERLALYHKNSKFKAKFKNEVGETIGLIIVNSRVPNFANIEEKKDLSLKFSSTEANADINHNMRRHVSSDAFRNFYKIEEKNI